MLHKRNKKILKLKVEIETARYEDKIRKKKLLVTTDQKILVTVTKIF